MIDDDDPGVVCCIDGRWSMVGGESDPYTEHGGLTGGPAQHIAGAVCEAVNLPPKHMIDDDGDGDPHCPGLRPSVRPNSPELRRY